MSKGLQTGMSHHLIDVVQSLGRPRILVVGDLILDRYIWGDAERISQEAPVILLREERQEVRLGGASSVAHLLRGLEAHVTVAGVVGADRDGEQLRAELGSIGVDGTAVMTDATRPTTVKQRYVGLAQHRHPHQILRVDREVRTAISADLQRALLDAVLPRLGEHQAVLISDYAKGVCTPDVLSAVIEAGRQAGVPVIVDPASTGDYAVYRGATAITPNRLEAGRATNGRIASAPDAFRAGRQLLEQWQLEFVFVTLDSDGIALVTAEGIEELAPTRRREVYDITGAGDMVLAMIGVGAAAGVPPSDLAALANVAGGLEVEQIGVVAVNRQDILADLLHSARGTRQKVCRLDELCRHVAARRRLGQRIVFTNGCFDVLHVGHVSYLQQAAQEGDCLIVALNSDESIRRLNKAPGRPIFAQEHRAAMLAALEAVDFVIVFDEATPHVLLECLKPDLLVKGGTYSRDEILGRELVEAYGGEVKALGAIPGVSTTQILERIRSDQTPIVVPSQCGQLAPRVGIPLAERADHIQTARKAG